MQLFTCFIIIFIIILISRSLMNLYHLITSSYYRNYTNYPPYIGDVFWTGAASGAAGGILASEIARNWNNSAYMGSRI